MSAPGAHKLVVEVESVVEAVVEAEDCPPGKNPLVLNIQRVKGKVCQPCVRIVGIDITVVAGDGLVQIPRQTLDMEDML